MMESIATDFSFVIPESILPDASNDVAIDDVDVVTQGQGAQATGDNTAAQAKKSRLKKSKKDDRIEVASGAVDNTSKNEKKATPEADVDDNHPPDEDVADDEEHDGEVDDGDYDDVDDQEEDGEEDDGEEDYDDDEEDDDDDGDDDDGDDDDGDDDDSVEGDDIVEDDSGKDDTAQKKMAVSTPNKETKRSTDAPSSRRTSSSRHAASAKEAPSESEDVVEVSLDVKADQLAKRYTTKQLRDLLREHSISASGSKSNMISKLLHHGVSLDESEIVIG